MNQEKDNKDKIENNESIKNKDNENIKNLDNKGCFYFILFFLD
jgi:hypothetical protein